MKERHLEGGKDQYYTKPEIAEMCTKELGTYIRHASIIIEPSAGDGSFYKLLPKHKRMGFDIEPKYPGILEGDFLNEVNKLMIFNRILCIGNPPFGFMAGKAIEFFNACASLNATRIAFIVPKTFRKSSVQCKLNPYYHLERDLNLPKNAFIADGHDYDVPCCFQIWARSNKKREHTIWSTDNPWIAFTDKSEATFAIRRVGGRTGIVITEDIETLSESTTYFCKEKVKGSMEVFRSIDLNHIINSTAGVRSLSKREIHAALAGYYKGVETCQK